jgi:hypothetical protein
METKTKGYKTVYPKDIPKDQYSVIDSSMRTDRVKDTSVTLEVGDKIGEWEIIKKVSYMEVDVKDSDGGYMTVSTPSLLQHHLDIIGGHYE